MAVWPSVSCSVKLFNLNEKQPCFGSVALQKQRVFPLSFLVCHQKNLVRWFFSFEWLSFTLVYSLNLQLPSKSHIHLVCEWWWWWCVFLGEILALVDVVWS